MLYLCIINMIIAIDADIFKSLNYITFVGYQVIWLVVFLLQGFEHHSEKLSRKKKTTKSQNKHLNTSA